MAVTHMAYTGQERREGSNDGYKARQNDSFTAVPGIKLISFVQIASAKDFGVRIAKQLFTEQTANRIIDRIAGD